MQSSHVSALQHKHEGLDRRLKEEMRRPSPDASLVNSIKKAKLKLEEEIALN